MKEIIFDEVYMENFGVYQSPMILPLDKQGLTLIAGPNGVGKTTMFDAIPYTLFGITTKGLRGDDVVNDKIGKNCKTHVKFRVNGEPFKVERYAKHSKNGNTALLINKDGVILKKGHNEVKAEMERLLIPQKLFFNTLLFGQKIKSFFTDLTDSEQKEIFRNIINLNKYVIFRENAIKRLDEINKELVRLTTEIEVNSKILIDTDSEIVKLEKAKDDFNIRKTIELESLNKHLKVFFDELEALTISLTGIRIDDTKEIDDKIISLSESLAECQVEWNSINKDLETKAELKKSQLTQSAQEEKNKVTFEWNTKLNKSKDTMMELKMDLSKLDNKISSRQKDISSETFKLTTEHDTIAKELFDIRTHSLSADAKCVTCKQKLHDKETIEIFKNREKEIVNKMEEIKTLIISISNEDYSKDIEEKKSIESKIKFEEAYRSQILDELESKTEAITVRLTNALEKLVKMVQAELTKRTGELQDEMSVMDNELKELKLKKKMVEVGLEQKKFIENKITIKNGDIESKKLMIKEKEKQIFDDSIIDNYKIKSKSLNSRVIKDKSKVIDLGKYVDVYEFWKSSFSPAGIPSMLIDESIPFMNAKVSYYLDKLSAGRFTLSFDTMKENKSGEFKDKISIRVVDNQTHANSRDKLSGGQTRIVDIATILTLYDLQSYIQDVKFNIMIFDEIFDSLDDDNIKYVSNVLKNLVVDKSVFIISHRHIDQLESDNILNLLS